MTWDCEWFDYRSLGPKDKSPPNYKRPKKRKRVGRPAKQEKPHVIAKAEGQHFFGREEMAKRVAAILEEPLWKCRGAVNAVYATILAELELGHCVEIPKVGVFMFEQVLKRRYYARQFKEYYIRPRYKKMIFSTEEEFDIVVAKNTRDLDLNDHTDPRLKRYFCYKDVGFKDTQQKLAAHASRKRNKEFAEEFL